MARSILLGMISALIALPAYAADFYDGKTISLVTSTGTGGDYDVLARIVARHMPNHIPGHPNMIVQNMPGSGNVLATNYMYNVAPKDGTVIATINNAIPLHQVIDRRGVRYDADKFNWLGSTGHYNAVVMVWHNAGVKTIEDVMKTEVNLGGTGVGSSVVIFPTAMNNVLGTRFKIVLGYKSIPSIDIALERGEIQARSGAFPTIAVRHPDWIKDKKIIFLVQVGAKRHKDLPDVPLMTELAKTDEQRKILQLLSSPIALGRPYLAPPGVPTDRLAILRKAFDAMIRDKAFLAEADKQDLNIIDSMSHEDAAQIVHETIHAPPDIIAKAEAAMKPQKR